MGKKKKKKGGAKQAGVGASCLGPNKRGGVPIWG